MPEPLRTSSHNQHRGDRLKLQTLLGFDYGRRRIGIAVGQEVTRTATALCTVLSNNGAPDWGRLAELIAEWQPQALVVGLPYHADGSDSEMTRAARSFARQLEQRFELPVHTMDERLSSRSAAALQQRSAPAAAAGKDAIAARIILQDWLDTEQA
ncbi:MAG: Holliday junction resolvase RuvX [Pseudomonadota bacterium]